MQREIAHSGFGHRVLTTLRLIAAWIATWFRSGKDPHEYEFPIGQRLFITTDLGRTGVVRARRYDELTATEHYLMEREKNGSREWYPRMSLCISKDEIAQQPISREILLTPEQAAQFAAKAPQ